MRFAGAWRDEPLAVRRAQMLRDKFLKAIHYGSMGYSET
jgi:hypothetical protein